MGYTFHIEDGVANYYELLPLYKAHYAETQERMRACGARPSEFAPMMDNYEQAARGGWLLTYVARLDGEPVGASNVFLTNDGLSGAIIAVEESLYVLPEHRNGVGRNLLKFILADLPGRGVERLMLDAVTDLRAAKAWRRMGFTDFSHRMAYHFQEDR